MAVEATLPTSAANVTGALRRAAQQTGANFQYLLATAQVESNLNPQAKASGSSARGLFQFIEQTWLATLKAAGPALGYGQYAEGIATTPSGRHVVSDPELRHAIMALRQDPTANAMMAGAFTQSNAAKLSARLGRAPTDGELYTAHFLGPNGAARLIETASADPDASAADLFPRAARANPAIFFDKSGEVRSVAEVAQVLSGRHDRARGAAPTTFASVAPAQSAATGSAEPFAWAILGTPAAPATAQTSAIPASSQIPARAAAFAAKSARPLSSIPPVDAPPMRPARTADTLGHRLLLFASTLAGTMPTAAESSDAIAPSQPVVAAVDTSARALGFAATEEAPRTGGRHGNAIRTATARSHPGETRRDGVAPLVSDLWGSPPTQADSMPPGMVSGPTARGLEDLFRVGPPRVSALFSGT